MAELQVLSVDELAPGEKKAVQVGETEVLLIRLEDGIIGVQAKCPHAGAPLAQGAVCERRLVCPWHLGTFALPSGELLEPPPLESLQTFRVRVEDGLIFVDPEPLRRVKQPAKQTSTEPVFLIVGAGAAGVVAATTLRQEGATGRIIVVDPVVDEPVDRTQLSKDALGGKMPLDEIGMDALDHLQVERLNSAVIKLSAGQRIAHLASGESVRFDRALLATGGQPKRLDCPGAELAHVIRHRQDVQQILDAAAKVRTVAIVGTSFIGLEAASALVQKGLQVTVIGKEAMPFSKQFGAKAAAAIQAMHERKGTRFRLGVEIVRISAHGVTIREAAIEEEVPGELVILGVGVTPALDFEHDLPLADGGGIQADRSLRAAESVWVAGDIANVEGTRIEHWRVAQQHARVAAMGMLGQRASYEGVPYFWTYHFGKRLGYLGHAKEWDDIFVKGDVEELKFISFYLKSGTIQAILGCDFETEMAALVEPMRREMTLEDALRRIA